jgi:hypothetical protein
MEIEMNKPFENTPYGYEGDYRCRHGFPFGLLLPLSALIFVGIAKHHHFDSFHGDPRQRMHEHFAGMHGDRTQPERPFVPPMFDMWHRRAHAAEAQAQSAAAAGVTPNSDTPTQA